MHGPHLFSETVASRDAGAESTGKYPRRVSETKVRSMFLEHSPYLGHLGLGEFQHFKPGLVGRQWHNVPRAILFKKIARVKRVEVRFLCGLCALGGKNFRAMKA